MSFIDTLFGSKPEVAPYVPTDLGAEQLKSLQDNINSFGDISQLGDLYEQYMLNAFSESGLDLGQLLSQGGQVTRDMLSQADPLIKGQIPQDVQDQIQRSSAYQSLLSGTAGSPMAEALTARDLGLTSLDLINQGAQLAGAAGNAAQRWAGLASGLIMSPSGSMVTPQQLAQMQLQNNLYKQATQQLQYNINAQPASWVHGTEQAIGTVIGAALGTGGIGQSIGPIVSGLTGALGGTPSYGQGSATSQALGPALEGAFPTAAQTYGDVFNQGGPSYG